MRKTVAFGFVGTVLDYAGRGSQRWSNGVRHSVYASKNR
ncbi:transcriptional regulator [Escherichia coli]|uniref:Transcriptional regulator n=1 Tax=Escherichia coli TaxID=562 RepID=A0A377JYS4_ECOLX|nr:transcriptional regulator [Escherichia coli]